MLKGILHVIFMCASFPQSFVPRPSSQRYAELPSLRYGTTPTPTATQMMGSGPLRVSMNLEGNGPTGTSRRCNALRNSKRHSSFETAPAADANSNYSEVRGVCEPQREEAPPVVRRVRFAQLPPKCGTAAPGRFDRQLLLTDIMKYV